MCHNELVRILGFVTITDLNLALKIYQGKFGKDLRVVYFIFESLFDVFSIGTQIF